MKTVDFSETIEACDLKVGRHRQLIDFMKVCECSRSRSLLDLEGNALASWLERRTPDRETRVRSSAGSVCCFLEQETFTPQKYW